MNDSAPKPYIPTEDDIVFDCPSCGRELAINFQGAGLKVSCPHCNERVDVPIPEDVHILEEDDEDTPPETKSDVMDAKDLKIVELAEQLGLSESRVNELVQELVETRQRRKTLENERHENLKRFKLMAEEINALQNALDRLNGLLADARG